MAKVIYENREFKDQQGMTIKFDYIAIKGEKGILVQLKNLVQSEKELLRVISESEIEAGDIISRKATEEESPQVSKSGSFFDDED